MLSESDMRIVHLVSRMHYLTADQVIRRYYRPGSASTVKTNLKALAEGGYLTRQGWDPLLNGGSRPYVYSLSGATRSYLVKRGMLPQQRFRKSEVDALKQYPSHTLAVNDILIAAELVTGAMTLDHFVHERVIQRMPIRYKPDAYLHFGAEHGILLEVDLDTEIERVWTDKIKRLVVFVSSTDYEYYFPRFRGVLVAGSDEARTARLKAWTDRTLVGLNFASAIELFTYVTLEQARDPGRLPLSLAKQVASRVVTTVMTLCYRLADASVRSCDRFGNQPDRSC